MKQQNWAVNNNSFNISLHIHVLYSAVLSDSLALTGLTFQIATNQAKAFTGDIPTPATKR